MIRRSTLMWTLAAVAVGAGLFVVKHRVQELEDRLAELNRAIAEDREAIHVLNAEWSYLNRPERLEDLGRRLLGLQPAEAARMVRMDGLDERLSPPPDIKTAAARPTVVTADAIKKPRRETGTAPVRQSDAAWVAALMAKLGRPE